MSGLVSIEEIESRLKQGGLDARLAELYGAGGIETQKRRHLDLLHAMLEEHGPAGVVLVSAPGRSELGGNHTDHNHGRVLAAAVDLDCLAVAAPREDMTVHMRSAGFGAPLRVDLSQLKPLAGEQGRPESLIRGVAAEMHQSGFSISGFSACVTSRVPLGGGLSSSAAFEILLGCIFNQLFNQGRAGYLDLAQAGHGAENRYFGKPCGRMDQIASALGGLAAIDFKDPAKPLVDKISFSFNEQGYCLAVVETGGGHAGLTPHYAAITDEMRTAAALLGREAARGISMDELWAALPLVRKKAGDRAALRLMHFIDEDQRAAEQARALRQGRLAEFLELVNQSGDSSWHLLQNCSNPATPADQPIPLALAMTRRFLGNAGACRVHGGGFAGTIQAYIPLERLSAYQKYMEAVFGAGSVTPLRIRNAPAGSAPAS
jgi:galactokinase